MLEPSACCACCACSGSGCCCTQQEGLAEPCLASHPAAGGPPSIGTSGCASCCNSSGSDGTGAECTVQQPAHGNRGGFRCLMLLWHLLPMPSDHCMKHECANVAKVCTQRTQPRCSLTVEHRRPPTVFPLTCYCCPALLSTCHPALRARILPPTLLTAAVSRQGFEQAGLWHTGPCEYCKY